MKKTYLKYFLAMFAIISILYLTACGGGGGGGNSVAPTPVAPSVRIIVDGSIFGDLASIRVSNRKIAEDKQFVSDPLVKKRKFQNERTSIKSIKGVEDKNEIKFGKISNFKNQKALLAEKKQIVNEAKKAKSAANLNKGLRPSVEAELKANLALPLIIKTTAYSNGKPVAGVVIDDRTATASGTNYVCDITGLNNSYDYRFAAYYNDKLLIQKHVVSLDIANGKDIYLTVYDHYKAITYDAWVAMQPNGGTFADFLKYCQQAGIDVNKSDAFVFLCNISLYDYKNALQTIVKGGDSSIPTVKNVDIGKIISNINGDNTTPDIPIPTNSVDVAFTIASNAENIVIDGLYKLNPNFNISFSSSYAFNDSDKTKILNAITVSNITNDKVIKIWNENDILLSFTGNLAYNATYTISMASITDIDGVNITSFNSLTFTTIDKNNIVFTIVSNNENIISENLYKLNPDFTISFAPNYDFNETNKVEILNAISVSEISGDKIVKSWNDNNIALSFTENLAYNTNYTISMSAVSDIEGINITCFDNFSFTTVDVNNFSFSISYNLNGGVVASANPTGYNIDSETFALNNPTKEGYTFTGWTGSNGDTPQTTVSIAHGSTGNKTYTANWSVNSYSVAVNMGSGISAVTGAGSYEYGTNVVVGYTLANGYAFSSWTGDKNESTFTMPASNVTMQANAAPISYSVSYNLNGGSVSVANPISYDVTSATITLNNPTKEGYTFTGWTGSNGDTPQTTVTISQGSTGDKTYTANWSVNSYSVAVNMGSGISAVTGADSYEYGANVVVGYTLANGYAFSSWTGDKNESTFTMPASNVTMQANAAPISYSVSYNLNGGSVSVANPISYDVTSATITLNNPTKEGYTFTGWTGSNGVTPQTTVTIAHGSTGNKSYTASWTQIPNAVFSISSDESNYNNYGYKSRPVFIITFSSDRSFDGDEKTEIADLITVSNVSDNKITKQWNDNSLSISFNENLQSNTEYTLSMTNETNIEDVVIIPFESFSFTTRYFDYQLGVSKNGNLSSGYFPSFKFTKYNGQNKDLVANTIRNSIISNSIIVKGGGNYNSSASAWSSMVIDLDNGFLSFTNGGIAPGSILHILMSEDRSIEAMSLS